MQRNMRRERQRDPRDIKKPLALVPTDTKAESAPCEVLEPTLLVPRSWTMAFCLEMAKLAMDDKNPVPPHLWKMRAYAIEEFEAKRKKKHPFDGMPVDQDGREVSADKPIPSDWKTELLGMVADKSERIPHAE